MRKSGLLDDRSGVLAAHDHVAWCGDSGADFARVATHAFMTSHPDERLVLVADPDQVQELYSYISEPVRRGQVLFVDAAEAYRPVLEGPAGYERAQLAAFAGVLDKAIADGYSGMRVVADNTPALVADDEAMARWLRWEQLTDRWQSTRPVTGICFFDPARVPADRLARAARLHPLSRGIAPSVRIYHEDAVLVLDGEIEAFDAEELRDRVGTELNGQGLTVDLRKLTYMHHRALEVLNEMAAGHGPVVLRDPPPIVRTLLRLMPDLDRLNYS